MKIFVQPNIVLSAHIPKSSEGGGLGEVTQTFNSTISWVSLRDSHQLGLPVSSRPAGLHSKDSLKHRTNKQTTLRGQRQSNKLLARMCETRKKPSTHLWKQTDDYSDLQTAVINVNAAGFSENLKTEHTSVWDSCLMCPGEIHLLCKSWGRQTHTFNLNLDSGGGVRIHEIRLNLIWATPPCGSLHKDMEGGDCALCLLALTLLASPFIQWH